MSYKWKLSSFRKLKHSKSHVRLQKLVFYSLPPCFTHPEREAGKNLSTEGNKLFSNLLSTTAFTSLHSKQLHEELYYMWSFLRSTYKLHIYIERLIKEKTSALETEKSLFNNWQRKQGTSMTFCCTKMNEGKYRWVPSTFISETFSSKRKKAAAITWGMHEISNTQVGSRGVPVQHTCLQDHVPKFLEIPISYLPHFLFRYLYSPLSWGWISPHIPYALIGSKLWWFPSA